MHKLTKNFITLYLLLIPLVNIEAKKIPIDKKIIKRIEKGIRSFKKFKKRLKSKKSRKGVKSQKRIDTTKRR